VRTRLETAHIAEVEIESHKEATFLNQVDPEAVVRLTREALVKDPSGLVATLSNELEMRAAEILVQLDCEARHRSGTSSSSRARSAA